MAASNRFSMPLVQWMDQSGVPLTGGNLYFYATGTNTPLATYSNAGLTVPNANPVEAGDTPGAYSNGVWPDIYLQDALYKVVLKDTNGVTVWTADPVSPFLDVDPVITSYYDLPIYIQGKPTDAETYPIFNAVRSVTLPVGLTDSIITAAIAATSNATATLYKNGVSIGTLVFHADNSITTTFLNAVTFLAGDQLSVVWPTPQDSTLAAIAITFVFTVN